ncbi:hypothetical protein F4779DRAFT_581467 [Xylariaceae sp. FL0662B]|nr:hypothetical protein F4779DRAFT_581467 [Xylariaceae sp. FL0662B]
MATRHQRLKLLHHLIMAAAPPTTAAQKHPDWPREKSLTQRRGSSDTNRLNTHLWRAAHQRNTTRGDVTSTVYP